MARHSSLMNCWKSESYVNGEKGHQVTTVPQLLSKSSPDWSACSPMQLRNNEVIGETLVATPILGIGNTINSVNSVNSDNSVNSVNSATVNSDNSVNSINSINSVNFVNSNNFVNCKC